MATETILGGTEAKPIHGDLIGTAFAQLVKLDAGADGVSAPVNAAAPLPVVQTGTPGLPTGAATEATLAAGNVLEGAVNETAPGTDTASSGLNGRLQRIAQRLSSLIALLPTALGAGGGLKVDGSGTALPVSLASQPLPTGAATETTLAAQSAKLPATLGQKAKAASMAVVLANDSDPMSISGSVTATGTLSTDGTIAHDAVDSGNPVKVGGKARNAFPAAVANGDRTDAATDLFGRMLTAEIDPAMQVHKSVNVTTTQTGTDVWSPASGKRIAVTSLVIGSYGTTAARVILWFGDNADTTFTAGTDQQLFAASFAPSATAKPGAVYCPRTPIFCTVADRELHLTTDAGISLDITVEGYEY